MEKRDSKEIKDNIEKDFFVPELLEVINRANIIWDGHLPRKVQIVSILLFLFIPQNKGLLAQIKTREGKTIIASKISSYYSFKRKIYININ